MKKSRFLVNDFKVVTVLRRITENLASDLTEREDLLQEALLHLWVTELRQPGQSVSWYLQSCRFHLQHYLARGRSVDSKKRSASRLDLLDGEEIEAADAPAFSDRY